MRLRPEILARHAVPALLAAGRPMTLDWLLGVFRETLADHADAAVRPLARLTPFELTQGLLQISDRLADFGLTIRLGPGTAQVMVLAPADSPAFRERISRDRPSPPAATEPQLEIAAALLFKGPLTSLELARAFDKDCGYLLNRLYELAWVERRPGGDGQLRWHLTDCFLGNFGWQTMDEALAHLAESRR